MVKFNPEKYSTNPDLNFLDVRMETYRVYVFPPPIEGMSNVEYYIEEPEAVAFKGPVNTWTAGGSHRVVDKSGISHYVPAGWIGIRWGKAEGKLAYEW